MSKAAGHVELLDYTPNLAPAFKAINEEWITEMFTLEEADRELLDDPDGTIIAPGGRILFAQEATLGIVGTCALARKGNAIFELTKMGVLKRARGLGVGEILLRETIALAREMGVENLFLLTNHRCEAAIHLYRKHGFEDDAEVMARYGSAYERCDVAMRYRG